MNMLIYTVCWVCFCLIAVGILLADRKRLAPELRPYVRFLCVPWKLCIFIPALLFITFAGHFTDDETWDIVTGCMMSIFTYATAPWSVGLVYQVFRGKRPPQYLIVAIAFCLFSSSWCYDAYLYLRDGHYTVRWLGNLMLSPIMYTAGGLLWNLEPKNGLFASFSFLRPDWPEPAADNSFRALLPIAMTLIALVGSMLFSYVRWHF
jgi:hypothetical protein